MVANELVEKEWIPLGLPHDRRGVECDPGALDQRFGKLTRLDLAEAWDVYDVAAGRQRCRPGWKLKLGLAFVDADGTDEKERRRIGRPEDVAEQGETVGVGPL